MGKITGNHRNIISLAFIQHPDGLNHLQFSQVKYKVSLLITQMEYKATLKQSGDGDLKYRGSL